MNARLDQSQVEVRDWEIAALLFITTYTGGRMSGRWQVRGKIFSDFREIAAEPLPDKDGPTLTGWNINQRFFKEEPPRIVV